MLPARQAKSRKSPYGDPVREIRVRIETGKVLRLFTNDLDASADEIAALYKRRWEIELFFRQDSRWAMSPAMTSESKCLRAALERVKLGPPEPLRERPLRPALLLHLPAER